MNPKPITNLAILFLAFLSGCATIPSGPSVAVMPGAGKSFEAFQTDDAVCRQWAHQQMGGMAPDETFNQNTTSGAILGAIIGGGLGVAIGAAAGDPGAGAAIGGAAGLLGGMSIGADNGATSAYALQNRYDIAYGQCMSAKGHQVPTYRQRETVYAPSPPTVYYYPAPYYFPPAPLYYYPRAHYYPGPYYHPGHHRW
jgi:hypothetical protein